MQRSKIEFLELYLQDHQEQMYKLQVELRNANRWLIIDPKKVVVTQQGVTKVEDQIRELKKGINATENLVECIKDEIEDTKMKEKKKELKSEPTKEVKT